MKIEETQAANTESQRPGDEMLTKDELAARMKVSVRTIEQWQHDGHLPFIKVGQVLLFYWPDVVRHFTANFTVRRGEIPTPVRDDGRQS